MGRNKERTVIIMEQFFFDPQKTDIDEKIDLVLTLGNMLQKDEQAKMKKFIETMPTIIRTH